MKKSRQTFQNYESNRRQISFFTYTFCAFVDEASLPNSLIQYLFYITAILKLLEYFL